MRYDESYKLRNMFPYSLLSYRMKDQPDYYSVFPRHPTEHDARAVIDHPELDTSAMVVAEAG